MKDHKKGPTVTRKPTSTIRGVPASGARGSRARGSSPVQQAFKDISSPKKVTAADVAAFNKPQHITRRITSTKGFVQLSVTIKVIGLSAFVTFIVFFMIQVIWGTEIADALPDTISTIEQSVYWVELLLMLGIFSGLGISIIVSIVIGEQQVRQGYKYSQRRQMLLSSLLSFVLTFLILTFVSFVSMVTAYPEFLYDYGTPWYVALGIVLASTVKIIAYFVMYIFPYPSQFWLITIAIYFVIFTVLFIILVPPSAAIDKKRRQDRIDELLAMKRKGAIIS